MPYAIELGLLLMRWTAPARRHLNVPKWWLSITTGKQEPSMSEAITIGVDLAKNIFQVHGIDARGEVVIRRQLRRSRVIPFFAKQPRCLVGMEACATAHHWAREISALGHEVRLMPARYVKPYVKRNKN